MTPPPAELRAYLRKRAAWVWNKQGHAFKHGLRLREETLTEMLLLSMARDHSKHGLHVTLFNGNEEKQNGADWEWLIRTPFCQVALRIQAKRLYHKDTGQDYGGLGITSLQGHTLISQAAGAVPLYVFFNHDHGKNSTLLKAGGEKPFIGRSFWGCALAPARKVVIAKSNKLKILKPIMKPWHHLLTESGECGLAGLAAGSNPIDQGFSQRRQMVIERIRDRAFLREYVLERKLAGVAFLDFTDFRGG